MSNDLVFPTGQHPPTPDGCLSLMDYARWLELIRSLLPPKQGTESRPELHPYSTPFTLDD